MELKRRYKLYYMLHYSHPVDDQNEPENVPKMSSKHDFVVLDNQKKESEHCSQVKL
jgi:hypothetical protein